MNSPQVVDSLDALRELGGRPIWLAIGMFDGVHLGHRAVLNLAADAARGDNGMTVALTFPEHPAKFLRPGKEPPLLMDSETKVRDLLDAGVDYVVMRPFGKALAEIPAEEFPVSLKDNIPSLRGICVGENFRFGQGRLGDAGTLRKIGEQLSLEVIVASSAVCGGVPVSSSRIRDALAEGEIKEVNAMLGRSYQVSGIVVPGKAKGSELGFPTLNLLWSPQARPAYGVYVVEATLAGANEAKPAVANYGVRPTVEGADVQPLLEVHLLGKEDFSSYQPGDELSVELLCFLRPECKFDSLDSLKTQIAADKIEAEKLVLTL